MLNVGLDVLTIYHQLLLKLKPSAELSVPLSVAERYECSCQQLMYPPLCLSLCLCISLSLFISLSLSLSLPFLSSLSRQTLERQHKPNDSLRERALQLIGICNDIETES